MSLDESWPAFVERSFLVDQAAHDFRRIGSVTSQRRDMDPDDTRAAEIQSLKQEIEQLRSQLAEKEESEKAWTDLYNKLKEKSAQQRQHIADMEAELERRPLYAPQRISRAPSPTVVNTLEEEQPELENEEVEAPASTSDTAAPTASSDELLQLQGQLEALRADRDAWSREKASLEYDRSEVIAELTRVKEAHVLEATSLQSQLRDQEFALGALQERMKRNELELEYVRTQHMMKNHEREVLELNEQASVQSAHIKSVTTALDGLNIARDELLARVALLQRELAEERSRVEGLEEQNTALQKGIIKIVQDKHLIWTQASDLLEAAKVGVAHVAGEWQEDSSAPACTACKASFGLLLRRHHCRLCGLVFCSKCSSHRLSGHNTGQRACSTCFERTEIVKAQHAALPNGIVTITTQGEARNRSVSTSNSNAVV